MSMSFDRDLDKTEQDSLKKFLEDQDADVVAQDQRNVLFAYKQEIDKIEEFEAVLEANRLGDTKEMLDGSKYEVTEEGWKKVE